ncbi:hypothetical protein D3C84_833940 [compost metagenome]
MDVGQADDQAAVGAEVGAGMTSRLAAEPVRLGPFEQLALDRTLQGRGLLQGNQQGAQFEAAQVGGRTARHLLDGQAGLGQAQVDGGRFVVFVLFPGQQAGQAGQRGEGAEEQRALAFGQVERIAHGQ